MSLGVSINSRESEIRGVKTADINTCRPRSVEAHQRGRTEEMFRQLSMIHISLVVL